MWAGLLLLSMCLSLLATLVQGVPGSAVLASSPTSVLPERYRVELQESARVTTETVYLRDIARIVAVEPDENELANLAAVEVGRVPLVGQTIRIPAGYVLVKLRQARVCLDDVSIEFPPSAYITVNRTGTNASESVSEGLASLVEQIKADLIEAIRTRAEKDGRPAGASWDVEIEEIIGLETQLTYLVREMGARVDLSAAQADVASALRTRWTWDLGSWIPVPGRFTLFARLKSETSSRDYPVTVYGVLKASVTVVVARSQLSAGKLLGPEDVELKPVDSSRLLGISGVVTSLEDVYGRELQRSVAAGEPLRSAWLTAPLVFRRGDRFPVVVGNGWVTVTALLEALEDGRVGALVRCRNVDTGRVVMVRVTPEGPVPAFAVASN